MDPFSLGASVITVAALAAKTGCAFHDLRSACKTLPGRLHALSNEVTDLELVLRQVAATVEKRAQDPILRDQQENIPHLLKQARTKLEELANIVHKLKEVSANTKIPLFKVAAWRRDQPRLLALQEDIKTIKCSLNVVLGASNSYDMMRVRVDLQAITTTVSQSLHGQDTMQDQLENTLVRQHDTLSARVDQRINGIEELLRAQSAQLHANQYNQVGPFYKRRASYTRQRERERHKDNIQESVGIRVRKHTSCRRGCSCVCHLQRRSALPTVVDRVIGQMFVGYAGLPLLNQSCDTESCEKSQSPSVSLEYWFPLGFVWSQIVRLQLTFRPNVGPHYELSSLRRVPDTAQCVNFALNGNIEGLRDLFDRGMASPRDVSSTRGYSILRVSLSFGIHAQERILTESSSGQCTGDNIRHADTSSMKAQILITDQLLCLIIAHETRLTRLSSWATFRRKTKKHSCASLKAATSWKSRIIVSSIG